jgi:hypothetical protein
MQTVPLQAVPNQAVTIVLNNQNCQISVYQKLYGLFLDLYVDNLPLVTGVLCENLHLCIISSYLGFIGDLAFSDSQGTSDPVYTGLGTRFNLIYLAPSDFTAPLPAGVS